LLSSFVEEQEAMTAVKAIIKDRDKNLLLIIDLSCECDFTAV